MIPEVKIFISSPGDVKPERVIERLAREFQHNFSRKVYALCIYNHAMITWDENKRQKNIAKHGIDFVGADLIFEQPMVTGEDEREYDGEQRLQSLALLKGRVVFVVWTERETGAHIISIRKAERHEQKIYFRATG